MEKIKHALHMDKSSTHSGAPEGTAGPHSSKIANAADPRIDSDLDGSRNAGVHSHNTTSGVGTHNTHNNGIHNNGVHNTHNGVGTGVGTTGGLTGGTTHSAHTTAGPHSSNVANKLDPLVDSDLSKQHGTAGIHTGNTVGHTGTHTGNTMGHTGTHAGNTMGHTGTHAGNTMGNTGTMGGISHSTNAGPHDSNVANKLDPRVDSDLSGRGNNHGAISGGAFGSGTHATPGSGTAQNTAGPHNSDTMNKLDPRVDADLDGSKTFGGNKTHA